MLVHVVGRSSFCYGWLGAASALFACGGKVERGSDDDAVNSSGGMSESGGAVGSGGSESGGSESGGTGGLQTGGDGGSAVGGSSGDGGRASAGGPSTATCDGACCPSDAACYGNGIDGIGDECLAQRDNSLAGPTPSRVQFRQVWTRSTAPTGNTLDVVYNVLANASSLPWAECNQGIGIGAPSGFMQLVDLDLSPVDITQHTSRVGYAPFFADTELDSVRTNGLCMVEGEVFDSQWALPPDQMSSTTGWPAHLPPPMPQPWNVRPMVAKRRAADFDVATDRESLLTEAFEQAANGVFYFDEERGEIHGYWPILWVVTYTGSQDFRTVVPIREAETRTRMNNALERSCIGAFRGDALPTSTSCIDASQTNPQWGCYADECRGGEGPATLRGYSLIVELEQMWSTVLQSTLCVSYPTMPVATSGNWAGSWGSYCRGSPSWDPAAPDQSGLPPGDWCAATNSPATPTCHDAFRSDAFQVFQAFPIQDVTCSL